MMSPEYYEELALNAIASPEIAQVYASLAIAASVRANFPSKDESMKNIIESVI